MSLNWKEINCVLEELNLPGAQIQSVTQISYDTIILGIRKKGETKRILICLAPLSCRIHETFRDAPKPEKPLRFAQFLKSRIVNGWIEEAGQLGDNRIVRIKVRRGQNNYRLYIRLWSNAANFIVTDETGIVLDAMRRLPKKNEVSGGPYAPEESGSSNTSAVQKEYAIREFPPAADAEDSAGSTNDADKRSFNRKIDDYYAAHGSSLSLEALREQAQRACDGSIVRIRAALEKLREKEAEFNSAHKLREYGSLILANLDKIKPGDTWLETDANSTGTSGAESATHAEKTSIKLDPLKKPTAQAEHYFEQYRKAKKGLAAIQEEIKESERELQEIQNRLARALIETNPLALARLLKQEKSGPGKSAEQDKKRPGLSFRKNDWLIIVGRDAAENDSLLRNHVKGNDLWLHCRDYPGSYVFIKQRSGKTAPLEILLDAGNLALFYSKGRNNAEGDLYYTPVKYLRRAKNGPKGLVLPTQEKNLHIKLDDKRLKRLENCRIMK